VSVRFYEGTALKETYTISVGPAVNTIDTPSTPFAEQSLTVTPNDQNCNKVVVLGNVHLDAPTNYLPGSDQLFCNIFVNSN
jgi:hypothetical protein